MADTPSLANTIDAFTKAESLLWLAKKDCPIPSTAPRITSLEDLPSSDDKIFIVAPADECIAPEIINRKIFRVVERGEKEERCDLTTVKLDQFGQLEHLLSLTSYTGMTRLLSQRNWQAEDFREAVLKHYAAGIERLRYGGTAAVFGAQRLGQLVLESLRRQGIWIQAFIDNDLKKQGTSLDSIPVQALSQIADKELPVVIATTKYSNSIARQLEEQGFKYILPYSVMSLVDPDLYPDEIPYVGIQEDFAHNIAEYVSLFLCLADDKSRRVLDGLLNYRLDYDTRKAFAIADEYTRQYFDAELIKFSGDDVFIDLGGYDGDTVEKFIIYSGGKYRKIYMFEPDSNLLQAATVRLRDDKNIEYIHAGAYSTDGELRFAASGRTNGSFSNNGELVIPVRKIDSVVADRPTLIKMDIEGSETEALRGATNLLKTVRPKLAIAAYHFAKDLWHLVDVVRNINPAYTFYLRHYSESGLESVIYAI